MTRKLYVLGIVLLAVVAFAATPRSAEAEAPDAIGSAYGVCGSFKHLSFVTECKVSVRSEGSSIDMRMGITSAQAQGMCPQIVKKIDSVTTAFAHAKRRWSLRIFSPYSGSHPIAVCRLT